MLTAKRLREVANYDPITGLFTWKMMRKNAPAGKVLGNRGHKGHLRIMVDGRYYQVTNLAWLYMTGEWPVAPVRHYDREVTNNRWSNLFQASHGMRYRTRPGASGFKGVTADRDKWRAKVKIDGRYRTLGKFDTPEDAHDRIVAYFKGFP